MPIGWSGYPNGQIPLSLMTQLAPILGIGGYAQPDAAEAFLRIARDFEAAVGIPLKFSEAYRGYQTQIELFTARYVRVQRVTGVYWDGDYWAKKPDVAAAAVPGSSNHGWALAFDFAWPLTSWSTVGQAWFRANESRYNFSSAQGVADGEPWHKVYIGPTPTTAGGGSVPIDNRTDDDEMLSPEAQAFIKAASLPVYEFFTIAGDTSGTFYLSINRAQSYALTKQMYNDYQYHFTNDLKISVPMRSAVKSPASFGPLIEGIPFPVRPKA